MGFELYVLRLEKRCYVPRVDQEKMEMLRLNSMEDFHSLQHNKWGIPEPQASDNRESGSSCFNHFISWVSFDAALVVDLERLDLIIVPGGSTFLDGHS